MASWLKAAEDLLEGVDRRAKLVVTELSDEQVDQPIQASSTQNAQIKKPKVREKVARKLSNAQHSKEIHVEKAAITETTSNVTCEPPEAVYPTSYRESLAGTDSSSNVNKAMQISSIDQLEDSSLTEIPKIVAKSNDTTYFVKSSSNAIRTADTIDVIFTEDDIQATKNISVGVESVFEDTPVHSETKSKAEIEDVSHDNGESEKNETHNSRNFHEPHAEVLQDPLLEKQRGSKKSDTSIKVQEQLDEANGLLKNTTTTGQSKESRLARVCAGLSTRLQEYKTENAQLEELLVTERQRNSENEVRIRQLQEELSASKIYVTRIESNMEDAMAAKNSEIKALIKSMDVLKKQAAASEGKLASMQANMESIIRTRELTETRMMQALRDELTSAERRAEEEHTAHNATKMAAMEREVELEQRAMEASTALIKLQRNLDERASRVTELEQKLTLLEAECSSLNQELQDMETRARHAPKKSPEETSQILQMQAWQEEVERAKLEQRDAEKKLLIFEAEVQKMRVEMAGMKRDAEHYSRQEHMELEKRYRELTDLLYYKQTQLEAMTSEKAAAEFQLEKEAKRLQETQIEVERNRVSRRNLSSWEEDTDLKTLESLPVHHRHMAGASIQIQKAVKFLDSGAVTATRFLWRYPFARVFFLLYLVFVHLFLMYLLHRLQEQADSISSKDDANLH